MVFYAERPANTFALLRNKINYPYVLSRASIILSLLLIVFSASGLAQSSGAINGTVTDNSGAAIAGAQLTLTETGTNQVRQMTSSSAGFFTFSNMRPGSYSLKVTSPGFKELVLSSLLLTVGQQLTVHPGMQLGEVKQSVQVSGAAPPVNTTSAAVNHLVNSAQIQELPLNGRNALDLVALVPGVVSGGTQGQFGAGQDTFRVSGGRETDMNYSLDGVINMNPFYGIPNEYPNPDALQEFSVSERVVSASVGRGMDTVSAVTKSGTNEFHGSAFEFLRNTDLDSRPFFSNAVPEFRRNQFGGTVGGPILKNKLFFFVGYQGTRTTGSPGTTTYTTLSEAQRAGNFSGLAPITDPTTGQPFPNNIIPSDRIQPFASKFLNQYLPTPNLGADIYSFTPITILDQNQVITRVDYSLSDKDRVMVRYFFNNVPQTGTATNSGSPIAANMVADLPTRYQNAEIGYTHIFSPALLNEFRISYNRSTFGLQDRDAISLYGLGLPVTNANSITNYGLTPDSTISLGGYFTANDGPPTRDAAPITQISDSLSWVHGSHNVQFGFELYHERINELQNWLTGGDITFDGAASGNSAADFLLGDFSGYEQITPTIARLHQTLPSFYIQDDYRVRKNLTLNFGLRYDPYFGITSEEKQLSTFRPNAQSTLFPNMPTGQLYPGDAGLPSSITGDRLNNFAPRVGFAWDVFGNGKTSIRSSFGIFYIPMTRLISLNRFAYVQPFSLQVSTAGGNVSNIFSNPPFYGVDPFGALPSESDLQALKSVPFVPGSSFTAFALPWKTPSENQWSFSIQQGVGTNGVLGVSYVGSSSSHLYTSAEGNPAIYIPGASTLANEQTRRIIPYLGALSENTDGISANYNSLQVSYTQRYTHGLSLQASYTYAKQLGVNASDAEGTSGPRDPFNWQLDYGPSSYDIRHNFVTSLIWDLPGSKIGSKALRAIAGGWQISPIITIHSGMPFTITSGRDNSLTGVGNDTADQVGPWQVSGGRSKAQQIAGYFNTSAFVENRIGTFGNVGENSLYGPDFWNVDLSVQKSFALGEKRQLQFRTSFYNMFNHANLDNPVSTVNSPDFGQITNSSTPRVIEFGVHILF